MSDKAKNGTKKDFLVRNPHFHHMVPSRRLERLTYGLEGSCSIQLSYEGMLLSAYILSLTIIFFSRIILLVFVEFII